MSVLPLFFLVSVSWSETDEPALNKRITAGSSLCGEFLAREVLP